MKSLPVPIKANGQVSFRSPGLGLILPPEMFEGGRVFFDDSQDGIPIRPRLALHTRFNSFRFEFDENVKSKLVEVVVLTKPGESVEWPALDYSWKDMSPGDWTSSIIETLTVNIPSASKTGGEAVNRRLFGGVQGNVTASQYRLEIWANTTGGQVLLESPRVFVLGSSRYAKIDIFYPPLGGEIRLVRTSGIGFTTFSIALFKTT